ncbi:MAG: prealbumin-like fold domain-containing protein [Holdemanella porci]
MREKGKRLIAIVLSCLLLLSNVTVYAATDTEVEEDTQNTVSVSASEEAVTLPEEPTNGSEEEAEIQNDKDTPGKNVEVDPIHETDSSEILETPKSMVGIEMSSFTFLQTTTRSVGIPTVGSTATGTCYIGDTWNVNYPYQDYFHVNNFTGDLAGAVTVQDFECLDPTAALPTNKNASYEATVTEVNAAGGYVEYYVRVTPPGATDGVTRPDGEHLSGYQHVGGKVRVYRAFTGSLELIKSSANQTITNGNGCYSLKGAVYGLYQNGAEIARKTTDEKGYAKFENVTAGNYNLKEITPPKGYALDKTVYPVTINSSQTTRVDVKDYPQNDPVSILLGKIDKDTTQNMPQGSASLEGAEFTIKYYAVQSDKDPAESGRKNQSVHG